MAYVGTPIDTTNQFQSLVGKRFSGDASTTAFTLDVAPTSTLDIEVFVENVRQDPNSAYSLSGTTLTFAAAPPSGTNNIYVVHQAKAVGTISPAAGTVNADSFDNTVISGHTALATKPADTDEFLVSDAGTIKRVDYSLVKDGITMGDSWRLTTTFSGSQEPINANWERVDTYGFGQLGTGMTESSGIFTFPSTGIYNIRFYATLDENGDGDDNEINGKIQHTTDNSSYNDTSNGATMLFSSPSNGTMTAVAESIFDVTSTSTHKVRFAVTGNAGSNRVIGNSNTNQTYAVFIRLGDT